jgi:tetratricopeptide (TPR) repeat protein
VRGFVHHRTGYCLWQRLARIPEARVDFDQAARILDDLAVAKPDDMAIRNLQGNLHIDMGVVAAGPLRKEQYLKRALAHYEKCLAVDRSNPAAQYDVAHAHAALAKIVDAQIPISVGMAHAQEAIKMTSALVADYPEVFDFARVRAMAHEYAAEFHALDGRLGDARMAAEVARAIRQDLSSQGRLGIAIFAESLTTVADLDYAEKRYDAALAGYRKARTIFETSLAQAPSEWNRCNMAMTIRRLGLAELALGHRAEAAAATKCAREIIEPRIRQLSSGAGYWFDLACCHATLAGLAGVVDSGVPVADGPREAELATMTLREGLACFRPPVAKLNGERAFNPVRHRTDFQQFVSEMEVLAADRERKTPD